MFELIYRSDAQPSLTINDILAILNTSRNFNMQHNITGCLVYHNNEFVQILEGDKKIVQELYAKIEKDKRHTHVQLLNENEKTARAFHGWSLAFYNGNSPLENETDKQLFTTNFKLAAAFTNKATYAEKLFWHIATQLMEK